MTEEKRFVVRCRAIILHDGKLLVVRHPHDTSFAALPGGKLEWGEDIRECMRRELVEELGIEPELGRFLYVHSFVDRNDEHSIEFFFEITNGEQYVGCEKLERSHAAELANLEWVSPGDSVWILPQQIASDFATGKLLADETRFIAD